MPARADLRFKLPSMNDTDSIDTFSKEEDSSQISGAKEVNKRLATLYSDVLNAAGVVKQVQIEVSELKQENARLRSELQLTRDLPGEGPIEVAPMRLSSVGELAKAANDVGNANDLPQAPACVERPSTPTEPILKMPSKIFMPQDDDGARLKKQLESAARASLMDIISVSKAPVKPDAKTIHRKPTNLGWVHWSHSDYNLDGSTGTGTGTQGFGEERTMSTTLSSTVKAMGTFNGHGRGAHKTKLLSEAIGEEAVRHMLFDPDVIKAKMHKAIVKPDMIVSRYYHTKGCFQKVARSRSFESATLTVILLNVIWIAVDTEHNRADVLVEADIGYQITEHCFCLYFFLELVIRIGAFKYKRNCIRDNWFLFDTFLVVAMVFEDWIMSLVILLNSSGAGDNLDIGVLKNASILRALRLLRLTRLGRAVKLLRSSPEIMIMVKALLASMRCVVWTFVLLACMMFFFGCCFTQMTKDTDLEEEYFPSLTGSMHTLMIAGIFPDLGDISKTINECGFWFWLVFLAYLMMTSITVLNLLIGVLVEVVKSSATVERDAMDVAYVKEVFVKALNLTEVKNFHGVILTKEEFAEVLQLPEILKTLTRVGIDVFGLIDLIDFIFLQGPVGFAELLQAVLQLRSSAEVTVRDLVEVRKFLTYEMNKMKLDLSQLNAVKEMTSEIVQLERQKTVGNPSESSVQPSTYLGLRAGPQISAISDTSSHISCEDV